MKQKLFGALILCSIGAQAQLVSINENFNAFLPGDITVNTPQQGWTVSLPEAGLLSAPSIFVSTGLDRSINFNSGAIANEPSYLISPEIVPPEGNETISLKASLGAGSVGDGTVEVGLLTDPADVSTFVSLGNPTAISTFSSNDITVDVPQSAASHIAFKVTPDAALTRVKIDDISYASVSVLAVSDTKKSPEKVQFATDAANNTLLFLNTEKIKNIKIYSATGQKVAEGKPVNNTFDIRNLHAGIYYFSIKNDKEVVLNSKFLKK